MTAPTPGDKGYAAHWRRQVRGAGLPALRGLPEDVSGRALLDVLLAFGERMDNRSGEAWPSQARLAQDANRGKRTVERALSAARRLGWLEVVAQPIPRVRGTRYRGTVPALVVSDDREPATSGSQLIASSAPTHRQQEADSSSVGGEQTLYLELPTRTPTGDNSSQGGEDQPQPSIRLPSVAEHPDDEDDAPVRGANGELPPSFDDDEPPPGAAEDSDAAPPPAATWATHSTSAGAPVADAAEPAGLLGRADRRRQERQRAREANRPEAWVPTWRL